MKKLLVCVDYQNDFVNGILGFDDAVKLENGIFERVSNYLESDAFVLFTRDTHDNNYLQTAEGKFLPIAHCIKNTLGHELYGKLSKFEHENISNTAILDKPTFGSPDIAKQVLKLCGGSPDKIEFCGVVTNICVISNAIILQTAFPLAEIVINAPLCAAVGDAHQNALSIMQGLGMKILN